MYICTCIIYIYIYIYLKAQAPNRHRALEIRLKKRAEALSRRTNFKKMTAEICHTAGDFMAAGVSKTTFLMSFWCPGTHPETPGDPRRPERGPERIQGGPGIDFRRFFVTFWLQWGPPGDDFWRTFRYFPGISVTFSAILFQSTFWRRFWTVP